VDNYAPVLTHLSISKKTVLTQLWHAGVGFKSVGYSRFGKMGTPHPVTSVHRKYTYATAPSEKLIPVYEEVFGIEKEAFLPYGVAMFDDRYTDKTIAKKKAEVYAKHPELKEKKVILFAPTFRGKGQKDAFYDFTKIDFEKLYEFLGDKYLFLFKLHPFTKTGKSFWENWISYKTNKERFDRRILPDISRYEDKILTLPDISTADALYVTDILITDYSSIYYEFAYFRKPILFYTYDRLIYETTRGVHQPILESAPGKVCDSFDELLTAIKNGDFDFHKTEKFANESIDKNTSGAAERIIRKIFCDNIN
jgi:CDP-ribitol ribitolphosphotransferase